MKKIIEAGELPNDEKVYLKKDWAGWRTVEPYRTPDGRFNWLNILLGGKRNIAFLFIVMVLLFFLYNGVQELVGNYKTIAESPCDYCESCFEQTRKVLRQIKTPIPKINFSVVEGSFIE